MNFNITQTNEYNLNGSFTHELINLYGIPIKLLITEKQNYDDSVFGDFQSIKANREDIFDLYALPENSEEYDDIGVNFSEFGMLNVETIRLFVSRESIEGLSTRLTSEFDSEGMYDGNQGLYKGIIHEYDGNERWVNNFNHTNLENATIMSLQSNLVVLPNNRIMEITDVNFMVPGINNLFTEKDVKNVYRITLKTFDKKLTDNLEAINSDDLSNNDLEADLVGSYQELDSYFNELTNTTSKQDYKAKEELNKTTDKVVVNEEDSVFGRF